MTTPSNSAQRRFLFLQGPHGPFFAALAARLRVAGAEVLRVGFNAGDAALWRGPGYQPFKGDLETWAATFQTLVKEKCITDVVCYGASRPIHKTALGVAAKAGLRTHVFEEGYLRPYWITYERCGANATSPLMTLTLEDMHRALAGNNTALNEAPDRWGDTRAHMFWGAVYHGLLLAGRRAYPDFRPHRAPGVSGEFWLHFLRLIETPFRILSRWQATLRIRHGGFPFHLALLQLAHDANFRQNGPFGSQEEFVDLVMSGFARGAPSHHHLVLKAHPLEDGREPLRPIIAKLTKRHKLQGRVHFVSGGKLARLLSAARSAITVNSTSAEQALWRGLPLKVFGEAVYNRPEFASDQNIADFFNNPRGPDRSKYLNYRSFLLATSQVPGGYYAFRSRRKLLRQLPDLMLAEHSPTEKLLATKRDAAEPQHLRAVS